MFHPGETITHIFTIPFMKSEIHSVVITYKQNGQVILVKTPNPSTFDALDDSTKITVTFSQEESLNFVEYKKYTIQLNVVDKYGGRSTSKEIQGENGPQHYKEVISNE